MNTKITAIILIFLLIGMIAWIIISKIKNKENIKNVKEYTTQLTTTLSKTNQHLRYKNKITLQAFITFASTILILLSLILLVFLPIFQIKIELLGITLVGKNFSFFDNYLVLNSEYNEKLNCFTDVSKRIFLIALIIITAIVIFNFVFCCFHEIKTLNSERRAEKYFSEIKTNKLNFKDIEVTVSCFLFIIAIFVAVIITCKNAEYKFNGEINYYTITDLDNYICYYTENGKLLFKVFQNYFKEFNAISSLIALPIIIFIIGVGLYSVGIYLKFKLKNEILKEEIVTENSDT